MRVSIAATMLLRARILNNSGGDNMNHMIGVASTMQIHMRHIGAGLRVHLQPDVDVNGQLM